MYTNEPNEASMEKLVNVFQDQENIYQNSVKGVAKLLDAIGYKRDRYSPSDESVIMSFLEDNPDALAKLVEFVIDNGDECDDWKENLAKAINTDDVFAVETSEADEDLCAVVRADTDEVIFDLLTRDEAEAKVKQLNAEVENMSEPLEEGAHVHMSSITMCGWVKPGLHTSE